MNSLIGKKRDRYHVCEFCIHNIKGVCEYTSEPIVADEWCEAVELEDDDSNA